MIDRELPDSVERHREVRVARAAVESTCPICRGPIAIDDLVAHVKGGATMHAACALRSRREARR
jgi:hypothetical protein